MATSCALSLRGGSGRRALPPAMPGRSAAKVTSSSGWRASARMQPDTARLNGSAGDSLGEALGLVLEDMDTISVSLLPRPACGERIGVRGRPQTLSVADRAPH